MISSTDFEAMAFHSVMTGVGASLGVGLMTGVGALPVLLHCKSARAFENALLGFAAGVMIDRSILLQERAWQVQQQDQFELNQLRCQLEGLRQQWQFDINRPCR